MTPQPPATPPPPTATTRPKRWPRFVFWGGIVLMTIGIVGALGDWGTRTWEMNQLLAHIKVSEDAMGTTKDTIGAIEIPSDATAEQKAEATDKLKAASAQGADEVAHAGDGVAALTFLPWHSEIIHAQAAYLAHNAAWVDYLERGSKEPVSLFGDDNRIEPTWVNAQRAVAAGIPIPALPLIQSAYDSLFTDDQPDDQSGGGGVAA